MKFKKFLIILLCFFSMGLFYGCVNDAQISFEKSEIEMNVGQELELSTILKTKNVSLKDLKFSTSNSQIAFISPNNILIARESGVAIIEAKISSKVTYLSVKVTPKKEKFQKVAGLNFDYENMNVKWDQAFVFSNEKVVFASSYDVQIVKDGSSSIQSTNNNFLQISQPGKYHVSVKAKHASFLDSEFSEEISFEVLNKIQNLVYDDQTSILSWDSVDNCEYVVEINNTSTSFETNSCQLDLQKEQEYLIKVRAKRQNAFSEVTNLKLIRLKTPSLTVSNGVLNFDISQAGLGATYKLTIKTSVGLTQYINDNTGSYKFEEFEYGQYYVSIQALGNNNNLLSSNASDFITIEKLSVPTLTFDKSTHKFKTDDENVKIYIKNLVTGETIDHDFVSNEFTFNENAGIYEVYAVKMAREKNQIDSEKSNTIHIKKLPTITNLKHKVVDGYSYLDFVSVSGCEGYQVLIDDVTVQYSKQLLDRKEILKLLLPTDELFSEAKNYEIKVIGFDNSFSNQGLNYFVLSEDAKSNILNVVRLSSPELLQDENKVNWEIEAGVNYFDYVLYKNNQKYEANTTNLNYLSKNNLSYGNYSLEIFAIGNESDFLSALASSKINLKIIEHLKTPQMYFDKQNQKLVISQVESADEYVILLNDVEFATLSQNLEVSVANVVANSGIFTFKAIAKSVDNSAENNGEGTLLDSQFSSVVIEKLPLPESLKVDSNGVLEVKNIPTSANSIKPIQIMINDIETENFDEKDQFSVNVRFLAKQDYENYYFIDSEISSFNVKRLEKVTNISLSNNILKWSKNVDAEKYIIRFENSTNAITIESDENSLNLLENVQLKEFIEAYGDGANLYITAYISPMEISNGDLGKISSLESEPFLLQRLAKPSPLNITPENSLEQQYVTIIWNQVLNATSYNISFNENISNTTLTSFQSPQIDEEAILAVQAVADNYLPSDWQTIKLSRVNEILNLNVLQNESIQADQLEGSKCILVNDKVELKDYNLSEIDQNLTSISLRNIASGLIGDIFYLNSSKTIFNFKRLNVLQMPLIQDNLITWERLADADAYEIKFVGGNKETLLKVYTNQISIFDEQISELIDDDILNYEIYVRGLVNPYTLSADETVGYLSGKFGQNTTLAKLPKVTNIKIVAEDEISQKNVTISFDAVNGADFYEIYVNDALFAKTSQNSLTTDKFQYDSSNNGNFKIGVIATKENCISSSMSENALVQRLAPIQKDSLFVSKEGVFSYSQNVSSLGYVTYYELAQNNISTFNKTTNLSHDYGEVIEMNYSGVVIFNVLALGNGQNILSSEFTSFEIIKLSKPKITTYGNHLEILSDSNSTNVLVVKFKTDDNEKVILTKNLTSGQNFSYPNEWNEIVEDGKFIFEVYSTCDGYLNSNTCISEQKRLSSLKYEGFYRDTNVKSKLYLQIDVGELKTRNDIVYILSLDNTVFVDEAHKPNEFGKLIYEIVGDFDRQLTEGLFNISIIATSNVEMDSKPCEISGKRLAPVSNIFAQNGILTWTKNQDVSAISYLLKLGYKYGNEDLETLFVKSINENFDLLTGISGQIVANVKNVGNVTTTLIKENVVLDSTYRQNSAGDENFTAFKLSTLQNLKVTLGDFDFDEVELAGGYRAKCDENEFEYDLIKNDPNSTYSSNEIYEGSKKLSTNSLYTIRVQATSKEANMLYSDYSSAIKIKVLENPNNSETISYSWSKKNVNNFKISYTKTENSSATLIHLSGSKEISIVSYENYYNINCNNLNILGGDYNVFLKSIGNSNLVDGEFYCLSSKEVKVKGFKKLEAPQLEIEDGRLIWAPVENANAYYLYYYNITDDEQLDYNQFVEYYIEISTPTNRTYFVVPESFGSKEKNIKYYFGVRAVYNVEEGEVAPSFVSTFYKTKDEENNILQEITKLKAPDEISLINGNLIWKASGLDYDVDIDFINQTITLNEGSNPFVYSNIIEELADNLITFTFVDNQNVIRKYNIEAFKLFRPALADSELFKLIAPSLGLKDDFQFGWPNTSFLTHEIGNLTPGAHYLTLSQQGNSKTWLTSMNNTGFEVYIPHAPKISISNYILSWDEIFLPQNKTYGAEFKYLIISENNVGKRTVVYQTNQLFVDLRELVNNGNLASGNHKLFVMVAGDNSYYLNGFVSNSLDILVLPQISASLLDGILNWDTVSQTTGYKLKLLTSNSNYNIEKDFTNNSWDFAQLQESDSLGNVLTYSLIMQAIGNGTNVISGKETDLGKITKLKAPNAKVLNGVFVWDNVIGNCGYQVIIGTQTEPIAKKLNRDKTEFESQIEGYNNYNFRTLGSTFDNLSSSSTSYAISNLMSSGIDAILLPSVEDAKTYEGNLVWKNVSDYSNASVNGYKLSFDSLNYYPELYLNNSNFITLNGEQYVLTELNSNYKAGNYKIYIQAYSTLTHIRTEDGKEYKLLLSKITNASTIEFYKLKQVQNIKVEDGIISWDATDEKSNNYKISFIRDGEEYAFMVKNNIFDSALLNQEDLLIYNNIVADRVYDIKIQTIGDNFGILNSDFSLDSGYEKLSEIGDVVYLEGDEEGFVIRWKLFNYIKEITDYNYVVRYSNMNGETYILDTRNLNIKKGFDGEEDCYYAEIDGSALLTPNSNLLSYTITVIPITKNKIISSNPSELRTVSPPMSITSGLEYSERQREISWTYDSEGSDVIFRIVDELVSLDENKNIVVLEKNTYLSKQTSFYPKEIGLHRISICVVLSGGNVASSYVYFNNEEIKEGLVRDESFVLDYNGMEIPFTLINNNLFTSGDGSKQNPYLLTSESDFANINYRQSKPSYFGGEEVFYFSLGQNLFVSETITQFENIFNGNNYEIYYTLTNSSNSSVALFNTLGVKGRIENLKINANITQNNISSITSLYVSALCVYNYGTIENCTVNAFSYTSSLNKSIDFYFGALACNNYGIVSKSFNKAIINLDGIKTQHEIRNSNLYVGGIVYNNTVSPSFSRTYGKVLQCGNEGNIRIYAKTFVVGGVVASAHVNSSIEECYNKGNIEGFVTTTGNAISYVGGLVGHNQGIIKNSYSNAQNIIIDLNSQTRTLYVGGLVGYASNQNGIVINNCYSSTNNIQTLNSERGTAFIGLLVGYSNAQDTTKQTTSYYVQVSGMVVINNGPSGFSANSFSNSVDLLVSLNATDYVYAEGSEYPILQWEKEL